MQAEKQMEDVENSSCRLLPPLLVLFSECDTSVSRLLPIFGGFWFQRISSQKNLSFGVGKFGLG